MATLLDSSLFRVARCVLDFRLKAEVGTALIIIPTVSPEGATPFILPFSRRPFISAFWVRGRAAPAIRSHSLCFNALVRSQEKIGRFTHLPSTAGTTPLSHSPDQRPPELGSEIDVKFAAFGLLS
ncbi:hypothetical protein AVEN_3598-1 [Araneus ventricosus]|uniref:Uncharacterized protein n=1 Tax=Araneus ventricosus TaxID=182803 RepID=A0A4Y2FNA6_ARAVE|nr:hypothetical protein AVEN_3598-1 [Araneus ventricosus]